MSIAIEFNNISKQYRLGLVSTRTLSHDLHRWWIMNVLRGEDPYLKIGDTNIRSTKGQSDYIWALRDINFKVEQGDVLGIIGKNGAGKSTLLKILSKVTAPTTGTIRAKGRIASLLEVGTGFHQEMTGRENIFMNGAILGMTKQEITRKLDEIIDFSGCERYIDTPVKRYSSGMMVRLGFAVAAHLEPEILVVDEVLAVGDAEFQKKAIGKMQDISKGEGRTVLFVSHNMTAVQQLCRSICVLDNGTVNFMGSVESGIELYLQSGESLKFENINKQLQKQPKDDVLRLLDLNLSQDGKSKDAYYTHKSLEVYFKYEVFQLTQALRIGFDIVNLKTGTVIFRTFHDDHFESISYINKGIYESKALIPANLFLEGEYLLSVSIGIHNVRWIIYDTIKIPFSYLNIDGINKIYIDDHRPGIINPFVEWNNIKK